MASQITQLELAQHLALSTQLKDLKKRLAADEDMLLARLDDGVPIETGPLAAESIPRRRRLVVN